MFDEQRQEVSRRGATDDDTYQRAENHLETAIGRQVRALRRGLDLTVVELARLAGLSAGMLSKIENGVTSPSLATLQSLARALNIPVKTLFSRYDESSPAILTPAGEAIEMARRGSRYGYRYFHLGPIGGAHGSIEPFLMEIDENGAPMDAFQHEGWEFIHVLTGRMEWRHGAEVYSLGPGDSLSFDSDAPHGPARILETPVKIVLVMTPPVSD